LQAKEVNKIVMHGYDALCLEETGARRQNKKNRNVIASDRRERGNLGIEIASPVFTEPALMKMGGQACKAPRNDKKENHRKIGCVPIYFYLFYG